MYNVGICFKKTLDKILFLNYMMRANINYFLQKVNKNTIYIKNNDKDKKKN